MSFEVKTVTHDGHQACWVLVDDHFPDLRYEDLLATAEPLNWGLIYPAMFDAITPLYTDKAGWTCLVEHGKLPPGYGWFKHRTALRFWKSFDGNGYRLDYEIDHTCPDHLCDHRALVNSGHISVVPAVQGVRCQTLKIWAVEGIPTTLLSTWVVPFWGAAWQRNHGIFFHQAAKLAGDPRIVPFTTSEVTA